MKTRTRAPQPARVATHRPIQRGRGLPLIVKFAMSLAVVALGAGVLYVGAGGLKTVATGLGSTVAGFVSNVTTTPSPSPSILPVSDAPSLQPPDEPYTSSATVDLVVTVPAKLVGSTDYRIRVYLALPEQNPAAIQESPIADTARTIIPVTLEPGANDFTVSIVGPNGESDTSPVVRWVLDTIKPKITITSPKEGDTINAKKVTIKGKVQARSTVLAKNTDNDATISGTAQTDGTFSLALALGPGLNHITLNVTDPAGNASTKALTVKRGTGKLTVNLTASDYKISRADLPYQMQLTCTATDADGNPMVGAAVTFTLSIPGIQTITQDGVTTTDGTYSFRTTINKGAQVGQGSATVLVSSDSQGSTSDLTTITITK